MTKLVFLLFVVSVSYTAGQDNPENNASANENGDNFSRPCSLDDLDCIKNYFASSGLCSRISHNDGDPIIRDIQVAYLPKFNVTVVCLEDVIRFFGSIIEKFEVNIDTNNLIMTVNFVGINIYSARTNFVIHRRGEEPDIAVDFANVTYSAAITAIIPAAGLRGVAGAAISAFNTNSMPPFEIGPNISESSDPVVSNFYNALVSDIPTAVQELLLTKASYFFYTYFQEYICNYGIEVTGEIIN